MAKAIMIQGTASGVGKTILTLALCRIFKQDGHSVSPFKAQNMTTNTCVTKPGHEIAVSQWLQALAADAEQCADINPVILKPFEGQTQVVLGGKALGTIDAHNFKEVKDKIVPEIMKAYNRLCDKYDIIVIEGAGSPAELNLNKDDVVNMGMAKRAKSPVILVSDIDRGGVFASLYGTVALLGDEERAYVKATVINRFRGDIAHFDGGIKIIEDITKLPAAGVIPYIKINLPEEDDLFRSDKTFGTASDFESQFNNIAETVRNALDMKLIYRILDEGVQSQ